MPSIVKRSLNDSELANYLLGQVNNFFPDGRPISIEAIQSILPAVLKRLNQCFVHINNKYFFDGTNAVFNHLHGDQYSMFLYLAANTAYRLGVGNDLASKLFLLNKSLHGIDAFYEVELPEIFLFVHPLGTVLGRANYKNYFLVYQNCGVGSNHDIYPSLEEYVTLRPGSSVLGDCKIGRNCTIAAQSLVLDRDLKDNTVYIGKPKEFFTRQAVDTLSIWRK
ncbi:MAG: serine acetyltransferase [Bdellovibrio sp.]